MLNWLKINQSNGFIGNMMCYLGKKSANRPYHTFDNNIAVYLDSFGIEYIPQQVFG